MSTTRLPVTDLLGGGACILFGIGIWLYAGSFPELPEGYPGPALFPRLIAVSLGLSGMLLLIGSRRGSQPEKQKTKVQSSPIFFFFGLVLVVLFPLVRTWTGVIPALTLLMLGMGLLLKVRPVVAVPTSLVAALLFYGVFSMLLGVPL